MRTSIFFKYFLFQTQIQFYTLPIYQFFIILFTTKEIQKYNPPTYMFTKIQKKPTYMFTKIQSPPPIYLQKLQEKDIHILDVYSTINLPTLGFQINKRHSTGQNGDGWIMYQANLTLVNNLGSGFKCYSNMHKLVSRPMDLCLNISIFQGPVVNAVQQCLLFIYCRTNLWPVL